MAMLAIGMLMSINLSAQSDSTATAEFDSLYSRAITLDQAQLYGQCQEELVKAIDIAQAAQLEKQHINTLITLAELKRKTQQFSEGIEVIQGIKGSDKYQELHVRKLGRLAALIHEKPYPPAYNKIDTLKRILKVALELSLLHNLENEEAQLRNELGLLMCRHGEVDEGMANLLRATNILEKLDEKGAYIDVLANLFEWYVRVEDFHKTDSIAPILLKGIEVDSSYTRRASVYNRLWHLSDVKGDELEAAKWKILEQDAHVEFEKVLSDKRLGAFRVLQETQKFQQKARAAEFESLKKESTLKRNEARLRTLTIYLSVLTVLVLGVGVLLYRERRLKQKMKALNEELKVASEKYQMLMLESNHRIKNNLQMIISMLQFAGKDVDASNTRVLRKMSGKIQTISALHKHLYADVHNEKVLLKTYFDEIIDVYKGMSAQPLEVVAKFDVVRIRSERIIYFGLIFNELLANTLEHNMAKVKKVNVSVEEQNGVCVFTYHDSSRYDSNGRAGMGLGLITQLIQRVRGRQYQFNPGNGEHKFQFDV